MTDTEHLDRWLASQGFDPDTDNLRERMLGIYDFDPEYWGNAGWWRVYDFVQQADADRTARLRRLAGMAA